jgi:hypothetical protein
VKLRQTVDDQGRPLGPFERPTAVWKALHAPLELYDVDAAADAYLAEHGPLIDSELGGGPPWFYAARWWREHRPPFLASKGGLTLQEAQIMARPRGRRPQP